MNLVSWNSSIQIIPRVKENTSKSEHSLWVDLVSPVDHTKLVGNEGPIKEIEEWFKKAKNNKTKSYCLFVHGESGTGKSTTVSLIGKKFGFNSIHTYADKQRTPVKLEGVVREAGIYGTDGVVILDEFEIFLQETTSLKVISKFLGGMVKSGKSNNRCLFVIISNSLHKTFSSIQDMSTIVEFNKLSRESMQTVFNRLTCKVRSHSYIPPMAAFFASMSCSGSITQGVQQLQFMYYKNKEPKFSKRPRKKTKTSKKSVTIKDKNNRDSISYLWCDIYTDKMLDHLTDGKFNRSHIMERLMGFGKDRLDLLGSQVFTEYPKRIRTSSLENLKKMSRVIDSIGLADINRVEVHEDGLYDGENRDKWSENDISYVSGVTNAILELKGLNRTDISLSKRNKSKIKLKRGNTSIDPTDSFYTTLISNDK